MNFALFIMGLLLVFDYSGAISCEQAKRLPDKERRARNYEAKGDIGNDKYVNDEYTGPGWFSVGDYKMPDSNNKPELDVCGTIHPIYVNGTHPDVSTLTEDSIVSLTVCVRNPFDECNNFWQIDMRKCGNDLQYYLVRSKSSQSAYCMDPPEIQNVTDFDDAPTDVQIRSLKVNHKLMFELTHIDNKGYETPYLEFECKESQSQTRSGVLYTTYWFVESVLLKGSKALSGLVSLNETELIERGYKLGFTIYCGVSVSTSVTGMRTKMTTSEHFYAGIRVDPSVLNMGKEDTAKITLQPTVPFGCYGEVGVTWSFKCKHSFHMYYPDHELDNCKVGTDYIHGDLRLSRLNDVQVKCGIEIQGFFPYNVSADSHVKMETVTMNIASSYLSDSDPTLYKLVLKSENAGTHDIYKDVILPHIQVNIITNNEYKKALCYAHVDPHMQTADGRRYEHQTKNETDKYIMYKHMDNGIEVQIRITECNNYRAYCVCAVAIRAGGDVFLINLCGDLRVIDMTSCKDGGVLVIQKYTELHYEVMTNIGTLIKIVKLTGKYANLMNVDIHMAPKDFNKTMGLCGTFDGDSSNDYHDRDGKKSKGMRLLVIGIGDGDINLLEPSCDVDVQTWQGGGQQLYCTCNCSPNQVTSCRKLEEQATCSPSQYINCSVSHSKNSELCQDYEERCSVQLHKVKKRSSVSADPEVEMKRRAALADRPQKIIEKRSAELTNITEEMAEEICTNAIRTDTVTKNEHLLGGFNLTQAIKECTWDVSIGQDSGWAQVHKQAADSAIASGFKRDWNYTVDHLDDLRELKMQSCPYNCSENGVCLENGTCDCTNPYFGPDCGSDRTQGPVIEDLEGGGFCDQRYGSECKCFAVQADKYFNQTILEVGSEVIDGRYRNLFNGECCFGDERSDTETNFLHYLNDVSLSNDGFTYGSTSIVYIYDSMCLNVTSEDLENVTFTLKDNTCLIDHDCYEENDVDISNGCHKCLPYNTQLNWTDSCEPRDTTDISEGLIVGLALGGVILAIIVIAAVVFHYKGQTRNQRAIQASQEFEDIRDQGRRHFNRKNPAYQY